MVDEETLAFLKEIQALLSHAIPDGDYNAILNYMGKQVLQSLRKKKGRSVVAASLILESTTITTPTPTLGSESETEVKMEMIKVTQIDANHRTAENGLKKELELKSHANTDKAKQRVYCGTPKQGKREFHSAIFRKKLNAQSMQGQMVNANL